MSFPTRLVVVKILACEEENGAVLKLDIVVRAFILEFVDLKCSTCPKGLKKQ